MGSASSKALSLTYEADRKEVLAKTNDTRFICDKILNYMLKDINISDFLLLANKRECSRYVIFLANTIDQRFRAISIVPSKGPGGKLYFKPGKEIVEPKPEEIKERQSLCIFLAYFYVRIFQILGAIMLTVIDDIEVHVKSSDLRQLVEDDIQRQENPALRAPLGAPALPYQYGPYQGIGGPIRPYREERRLFRGGDVNTSQGGDVDVEERQEQGNTIHGGDVLLSNTSKQEGGALSTNSNFIFLEDLLGSRERIPTGRRDGPKRDGYVFRGNLGMAFVPGSSDIFESQVGTSSLYVKSGSESYPVYEIVIKSEKDKDRDIYRLRIESIQYRGSEVAGKEEGKRILYSILERDNAKIERDTRDRWIVREHGGEEMTLLEFMKELRQKVDSRLGIRRAGRPLDDHDPRREYGRPDKRNDVEEKLRHSESDTDPALRVTGMLTALRKTQPLSHCVARGLQLLGTQVSGDKGTFHSAACDSKFHLVSDITDSYGRDSEVTRDALPKPGEGIDKIPGLSVLAQLFYDFVQIKTTTILRSKDPKDIASYADFMRKMIKVFDGTDYTGSVEDLLKMNLSSVKDVASQKACGTIKDDVDFKKGSPSGNNVIKVVRQLFGTQIQHAARCGQLLKQLFLIKKGDQELMIRINPTVMLKGFPELDRINRNARAILIDYYSKCEGLYKTGLQMLEGQQMLKQQIQKQQTQKQQQGPPQQQQQQQQQQKQQTQRRQRQQTQRGIRPQVVGGSTNTANTATRKNRPTL